MNALIILIILILLITGLFIIMNNTSDCKADKDCTEFQICQAGECVCDCDEGQLCDESGCYDCNFDEDCEDGQICNTDGMCVTDDGCEVDGDCEDDQICEDGRCVTDDGCEVDGDCPSDKVCDDDGHCYTNDCRYNRCPINEVCHIRDDSYVCDGCFYHSPIETAPEPFMGNGYFCYYQYIRDSTAIIKLTGEINGVDVTSFTIDITAHGININSVSSITTSAGVPIPIGAPQYTYLGNYPTVTIDGVLLFFTITNNKLTFYPVNLGGITKIDLDDTYIYT